MVQEERSIENGFPNIIANGSNATALLAVNPANQSYMRASKEESDKNGSLEVHEKVEVWLGIIGGILGLGATALGLYKKLTSSGSSREDRREEGTESDVESHIEEAVTEPSALQAPSTNNRPSLHVEVSGNCMTFDQGGFHVVIDTSPAAKNSVDVSSSARMSADASPAVIDAHGNDGKTAQDSVPHDGKAVRDHWGKLVTKLAEQQRLQDSAAVSEKAEETTEERSPSVVIIEEDSSPRVNSKELPKDGNPEELSGRGTTASFESSVEAFSKTYYGAGINNILRLRLEDAGIVDVKALKASKLEAGSNLDGVLSEAVEALQEGYQKVIAPCNIENKHWVGIVFEKAGDDSVTATYIDPENRPINEAIAAGLRTYFSQKDVTINEFLVEQQEGCLNCGAETIESLISLSGGERIPSEEATSYQQRLVEQELIGSATQSNEKSLDQRLQEWLPLVHKAAIAFKGVDTVVGGLRLYDEPTLDNAQKEAVNAVQLYAMCGGGFSKLSVAANLMTAGYNVYSEAYLQENYGKAVEQGLASVAFMAMPYMLGYAGIPYVGFAYGVVITAYAGYNSISAVKSYLSKKEEEPVATDAENANWYSSDQKEVLDTVVTGEGGSFEEL
jgi:hypothetical protein